MGTGLILSVSIPQISFPKCGNIVINSSLVRITTTPKAKWTSFENKIRRDKKANSGLLGPQTLDSKKDAHPANRTPTHCLEGNDPNH